MFLFGVAVFCRCINKSDVFCFPCWLIATFHSQLLNRPNGHRPRGPLGSEAGAKPLFEPLLLFWKMTTNRPKSTKKRHEITTKYITNTKRHKTTTKRPKSNTSSNFSFMKLNYFPQGTQDLHAALNCTCLRLYTFPNLFKSGFSHIDFDHMSLNLTENTPKLLLFHTHCTHSTSEP